jgi:TATA-box binding protein (TBP) (component of TFIID and TFIIIB)
VTGVSVGCAVSGTFTSVGNLSGGGRGFHTATKLSSGKVLIAGGRNTTTNYIAATEIYDPSTGNFTTTNNMNSPRGMFTATLLQNGKVLLAGGYSGSASLASAELYDPSNGTFTLTGNMNSQRYIHKAVLLNNGKVLIVGGTATGNSLSSAELYDPSNGTFTLTNSMNTPRMGHSATLLSSGKVLIAGGDNYNGSFNYLASAEIFDPSTNQFAYTGNLNIARQDHTSTLINNGKVLITGGMINTGNSFISCELYDPSTGLFSSTGSMNAGRSIHSAILLSNGNVLVVGGYSGVSYLSTYSNTEIYNTTNGTFSNTGSMSAARGDFPVVILDNSGKVLVTGGFSATNFSNFVHVSSAEIYTP